ncbi:MAG: alpha-E domain-containing protein, partial [Dehalococcoidia bacterium]
MTEPRSISFPADRWLTDSRVYNLIWMGRWLERTENVTRALNATANIAVSGPDRDYGAFERALADVAASWGINLEDNATALALMVRDDPASSIYQTLNKARYNATQVGPLELIQGISGLMLDIEERTDLPQTPQDTLNFTTELLASLHDLYDVIENRWFHRERVRQARSMPA